MLRFLTESPDPALILYGHYQPERVALSVLVAVLASWLALHTAASLARNSGASLQLSGTSCRNAIN